MILRKLTATFGRLDKETLELHEGLNVIARPNESGKSTWSAFLLAMLYGVDTGERAGKGNVLPVKTRYKPWNGQEMAGSMELLWNGREITVERSAKGRTPLGTFKAYETGSGAAVEFPESCGKALLGVERSVYQRTGFIGQQAIALTADDALETRLRALVSGGDETVNAGKALQNLRDLKNRRKHNKSGLIPRAQERLQEVEDTLDDLARMGREIMSLQAERAALEAEREDLTRRLNAQKAMEYAGRRERLEQARLEWEKREKNLREKERTVVGLPDEETLDAMLRGTDQTISAARGLDEETEMLGEPPLSPPCPAVFAGLDASGVRERAENDAQSFSRLRRAGPFSLCLMVLAAVLGLAGGIAGLALRSAPLAVSCFILAALGGLLAILRFRRDLRIVQERREILERYDADDETGIRKTASDYRDALLLYTQRLSDYEARRTAIETRRGELEELRARILARTASICPEAKTIGEARDAIQRAIHLQKFYQAAAREAQPAKARYEALREELNEEAPVGDFDPADAGGDPGETAARVSRLDEDLRLLQSKLDTRRGRMEASGDPAALAAAREELNGELARLSREYDALTLAMEALEQANQEIQSRFSPKINRLAGEYMARMTGGRYDRVTLDQAMAVTARETGDTITRPLAALSAGTADQLYLALRLAICQLLLPEDAPILLDDALSAMDDTRMAAAMELLADIAQTRQIILFSCHNRELAWLNAHK